MNRGKVREYLFGFRLTLLAVWFVLLCVFTISYYILKDEDYMIEAAKVHGFELTPMFNTHHQMHKIIHHPRIESIFVGGSIFLTIVFCGTFHPYWFR